MHIGIVAGEASGDLLGADLIKALRSHYPSATFTGIGGPKMNAEGCQSLFDMDRLTVMGLFAPLMRLPDLLKIRSELVNHFTRNKPDVFIGIDYPGFNLSLELKLKKLHFPIVHYVSPSVWAWHKKRIFKIAKAVDLMLTLFPFEADFYEQHKVPVCFVGHPLADHIPLQVDKFAARRRLNLDSETTYIAILPGSRRSEIKYLADVFIETAHQCFRKRPQVKFITSAISEQRNQEFQAHCKRLAPDLPIEFFVGCSHDVMAAADIILVTSGTATLEAMLFKRPMVIAYRMAGLTFQIARHIVTIPHIGLPNLLANERLVPEFIQHAAYPEALSSALIDFLDHPEKMQILEQKFLKLHQSLRCNASQQAATSISSFF